jgi:hypothetical protein
MTTLKIYFTVLVLATVCLGAQVGCDMKPGGNGFAGIETNKTGTTIAERYKVNGNNERPPVEANSFGEYLRKLKLKPYGSRVKYYNGEEKTKENVYDAVVDMEIGNKNLQQCADAIMRLRGEYLFTQKAYAKLHFNFTNGFTCEYSKWKEGYRVKIEGNKTTWVKSAKPSNTYETFRKYMDMVFNYAGTLSLSKELKSKSMADMNIGDVFIHGGSPGHAVIIVDMMKDKKSGQKYFMLAQSYMPAQETQVLLNPNVDEVTVWYKLDVSKQELNTPEWDFTRNELKSF